MKHARPKALDVLEPLLEELRKRDLLNEKKRRIFYIKSKAFLHFHEDPEGLFADIKLDDLEFSRYRVTTKAEQKDILKQIDDYVSKRL